jgi:hypothetical protein
MLKGGPQDRQQKMIEAAVGEAIEAEIAPLRAEITALRTEIMGMQRGGGHRRLRIRCK